MKTKYSQFEFFVSTESPENPLYATFILNISKNVNHDKKTVIRNEGWRGKKQIH